MLISSILSFLKVCMILNVKVAPSKTSYTHPRISVALVIATHATSFLLLVVFHYSLRIEAMNYSVIYIFVMNVQVYHDQMALFIKYVQHRFMSININQRYIILNRGCCRVFAENVSAKTRQHPRFKIMYR